MAKILGNITLENYRGHKATSVSNINDLLMLVGKNDIGKSSVLEALDVFFNRRTIKDTDYCMTNNASELSIKCTFNGKNYELKSDKNTTQQSYSKDGIAFPDRNTLITDLRTIHYTLFRADNTKGSKYNKNVETFIQEIKNNNTYKQYFKDHYIDEKISVLINNTLDIADAYRKLKDFFIQNDTEGYYQNINFNKKFTHLAKEKKSLQAKLRRFHFSDYTIETNKLILFKNLFKKNHIYNLESLVVSLRVNKDSTYIKYFIDWFIDKGLNEITPSLIDWDIVQKYEQEQNLKRKPFDDIESILEPFKNNLSPIEKRGSGVKRLCAFYQFAITAKTSFSSEYDKYILAVEEPEISLHPKQQRQFIQQLLAISKNDDIQVIATTHSPYIVNELEAENVCILKQITQTDAHGNTTETISTQEMVKRIIKYPSMAEINYLAFGEPSLTYHQELYGQIEVECLGESNGNKIGDIIDTIWKVDNTVWNTLISKYNSIPNRPFEIKVKNEFSSPDNDGKDKNGNTLYYYVPYCVRNAIDHPGEMNAKWKNNISVVDLSIKMLIIIARTIEKAEKMFLPTLISTINSTSTEIDDFCHETFKCSGTSISDEHSLVYWVKYQIEHPSERLIKQNRQGIDCKNGEIKNKINFVKAMYDIDPDWLTK